MNPHSLRAVENANLVRAAHRTGPARTCAMLAAQCARAARSMAFVSAVGAEDLAPWDGWPDVADGRPIPEPLTPYPEGRHDD